jgi:hypothetical protein
VGPLLEFKDPAFLRWSNLRIVVSMGLITGLLIALWDALWGGWSAINVVQVVFVAAWFPLVSIGLHLYLRPRRKASG